MIKLGDEIDPHQRIIRVKSFELNHASIHLLYDGVGWIVHDGEFMQYCVTFPKASRAMNELILAMLGGKRNETL